MYISEWFNEGIAFVHKLMAADGFYVKFTQCLTPNMRTVYFIHRSVIDALQKHQQNIQINVTTSSD